MPAQPLSTIQILSEFKIFLTAKGLGKVSIKNYVSDTRKFLSFVIARNEAIHPPVIARNEAIHPPVIARNEAIHTDNSTDDLHRLLRLFIPRNDNVIENYSNYLQNSNVPDTTIARYTASLRRFS